MDAIYSLNDFDIVKEHIIRNDNALFSAYSDTSCASLEEYKETLISIGESICYKFDFQFNHQGSELEDIIKKSFSVNLKQIAIKSLNSSFKLSNKSVLLEEKHELNSSIRPELTSQEEDNTGKQEQIEIEAHRLALDFATTMEVINEETLQEVKSKLEESKYESAVEESLIMKVPRRKV